MSLRFFPGRSTVCAHVVGFRLFGSTLDMDGWALGKEIRGITARKQLTMGHDDLEIDAGLATEATRS